MIPDDKIIAFLKAKGPSIPVHLVKEFKQDTIILGAILSSLASSKKLLISNTKIGGSPLYYLKEDEAKLQEFSKYLNEKDLRAYELLKENKVLRDKEMTPLERVSLRTIKDFAKPVTVTVGSQDEIFWKWYLLKPEESENLIRAYFKPEKEAKKKESTVAIVSTPPVQKPSLPQEVLPEKPVAVKQHRKKADKYELEEDKSLMQATLEQEPDYQKPKKNEPKTIIKEAPPAQPVSVNFDAVTDKLHIKVKPYFEKNNILIKALTILKNGSEIEYIIEVPSAIGSINYYCRARSKKKINDTDLTGVYLAGQLKKLPVIFLTNGEISKKAKDMLNSDLQNMKVISI
jgi:hypothetical protein